MQFLRFICFYTLLHFTLTTFGLEVLKRRGGENVFWPVNAILAAGIMNAATWNLKLTVFVFCLAAQTISYCGLYHKEFYWVPINLFESIVLGFLLPLILSRFTRYPKLSFAHAIHSFVFFGTVLVTCILGALLGAVGMYFSFEIVIGQYLLISTVAWFADNTLGTVAYIPCLCDTYYTGILAELLYDDKKTWKFWGRWMISLILITMSFSGLLTLDPRIDILRSILNIPMLMYLASITRERLSLVIFCIISTSSAFVTDYASEIDRSWARFYLFWTQVCNLAFINIFHSRSKVMESIEERVEARTKEINELRQIAIESSINKAELISYISHEIRNPVHAIGNMIECISSTPDLPPQLIPYIDNLRISNTFILDLVTEILDIGKLEANKFTINITPVKIVSLLRAVVDHTESQCKSHAIRFDAPRKFTEFPATVLCDGVKLQQILYNLISNAIKYTSTGGLIELSCSYKDGQVLLTVRDNGTGIPKETLSKLFEPYVQASSAKPGTGLGLVICKTFVEKLGGTITVDSVLETGSTFSVVVPAPETQDSKEHDDTSPGKVLVVDDSKLNRTILGKMLQRQGFQVCEADNGLNALGIYQAEKPFSHIISDLNMPLMNGLELRNRITDDVPFVIVTADTNIQRGPRYNVLYKPFLIDDLKSAMRN